MRTLLELDEEHSQAVEAANEIIEKAEKDDERALTDDEKTAFASYQRDITRLDAEKTERSQLDKMAATAKAQLAMLQAERKTTPSAPNNTGEVPKPDVPSHQKRYGKLRAFSGPDAESDAHRTGKFIQAALFRNDKAARWCREHGVDCRALSEGSNIAGGFLVPEEMNRTIIDLRETYGVFRRECRVAPMTEHMMTVPRRAGGVTATFTGEGVAATESDPSFNQVTLTARKLACLTYISSELSDDAIIDVADWVTDEFAQAFAYKEDTCGFNGTGALSFGGIYGAAIKIADGTHAAGFVAAASGNDLLGEIDATDLGSLMGALPEYAAPGAKWFCSRFVKAVVFDRLAAAAGGNTMEIIAGKPRNAYLGHEIVTTQVLPAGTLATNYNGLLILMFGDLAKAAVLGDRRQISIALSSDIHFAEDEIGIRGTERFDISVHDLGDGTTAGPLVALKGLT